MKIPEIDKTFDEGFDFDKTDNEPGNEIEEQENDFSSEISNKKKKSDKDGIVTGGASSDYDNYDNNSKLLVGEINITDTDKSSKTIAGVSKGNEMTLEEAMKGTNPEYSHFGNPTYRKNCQSAVSVFELRKRGYPVEYKVPQTDEERKIQEDLAFYPNKAYLIPNTKQRPSMNKINVKTTDECKKFLNEKVKTNERYIFTHSLRKTVGSETGRHVLILTKDNENKLKFYDPQVNMVFDDSYLLKVKFTFDFNEEKLKPEILRIDDKEFNYKYINAISQPSGSNK